MVIDLTQVVVEMAIKVNQKVSYGHGMAKKRMFGLIA